MRLESANRCGDGLRRSEKDVRKARSIVREDEGVANSRTPPLVLRSRSDSNWSCGNRERALARTQAPKGNGGPEDHRYVDRLRPGVPRRAEAAAIGRRVRRAHAAGNGEIAILRVHG